MRALVIIPARGGSKRIPLKNIKLLGGKPLIYYSIDVARKFTDDANICVSTDDDDIIVKVEEYGLKVPFKRPAILATDTAETSGVLVHALDHYQEKGIHYNQIILLQPTSPLRTTKQVLEAMSLYNDTIDMIVSVRNSKIAAFICEENPEGFLMPSLDMAFSQREKRKEFYEYNGAIYIINTESLREKGLAGFTKKIKYLMPDENSVDIDTLLDWNIAEMLIRRGFGE